ncbi:MAG: glycosyltransferase family 2 protein [Candidatus Bathyarchaeia archaeon]
MIGKASSIRVDVAVCTYQSEKYLDECLTSIERTIPFSKLIVVDRYSTDRTVEIAIKHKAEIYFENVSLGHARQVAIEHSDAPFILFVDSDVVFYDDEWFKSAVELFSDEKRRVGAIGIETPTRLTPWRQKYVDFWWKTVPQIRTPSFSNVYFLRRKAIEGIRIPSQLGAYEQVFIRTYVAKRGWKVYVIQANGMHYCDFPDWKSAWLGAGSRIFRDERVKHLPKMLARRVLTAWLKAIPPAIAYNDPSIIIGNTRYWFRYLKGWLKPEDYIVLKRD